MAKLALYQKYRSSTFEEMVGQEYIVKSIKNAVREGKVGHAYLFCGPRGTGKTSMARLLAKAVNCEHPDIAPCGKCENCIAALNGTHPDIVEINAANETHVDDIRELIQSAVLAPMQGLHKVYIIDEVHQLSSAASSALLKTLEEPPENVIFILATTDPQKLLPTIISRCQRFDFTKVRLDQIRDHLLWIAQQENIKMDSRAAELIALMADGGMRDALSIMDQCASYTSDDITEEAIDRIYGLATTQEKVDLLKNVIQKDLRKILERIRQYEQQGIDLQRFTDGMIDILKDAVIYGNTKDVSLMKVLDEQQAGELCGMCTSGTMMRMCEKLITAKEKFRIATSAASAFEVTMIAMAVEEQVVVQQVVQQVVQAPAPKNSTSASTQSSEVKTTSDVSTIEAKPKANPNVIQPLSIDMIVSLLVLCNKAEKAKAEQAWQQMKNMYAVKTRKYVSMLMTGKVAASGPDCVVVACPEQAFANAINEPKMNEDLYFFAKNDLQMDKMLYAITENDMAKATARFRDLYRAKALPKGYDIQRYVRVEVVEPTPEEKVIALFGAENVEIV